MVLSKDFYDSVEDFDMPYEGLTTAASLLELASDAAFALARWFKQKEISIRDRLTNG